MKDRMLEVCNLKKHYPLRRTKLFKRPGAVKALDGVSFFIRKGESFGLVGESGCGKTTAGHTIVKLLEPTEGKIFFKGEDITTVTEDRLKRLRRELQIIFQDTAGSLNPKKTVEWILSEPLRAQRLLDRFEIERKIRESMELVGLDESFLGRYPHELSGGQKQRIGILSALILDPEMIIADEPVSALDVSIQAQILNLMNDLRQRLALTFLFISHDLNVIHFFCDRIAVMYLGEIVELADAEVLYGKPLHPYTVSLLSAIPGESKGKRIILQGDAPDPTNPPGGCPFHPRCFARIDVCTHIKPTTTEVSEGHLVNCHLYQR